MKRIDLLSCRRGVIAALAATVLVAVALIALPAHAFEFKKSTLDIVTKSGKHPFNVELAISMAEQEQGLQFRKELAPDAGMLFVFDKEEPASFWMKNTYVSLDLIFIRNDGTIHKIAENAPILSLEGIPSEGPVRGVLEVIAGTSKRLGIVPGDRIESPAWPR